MIWLAIPGLLLLTIAGLELYGRLRPRTVIRYDRRRRTPWQPIAGGEGERAWSCLLPFENLHTRDQGLLLDVSGEIRFLLPGGRRPRNLAGEVSFFLHTAEGRRDGYFAAGTVEPRQTVWVEAVVTARGAQADLNDLLGGVLSLEYRIYTRHAEECHAAEAVLPIGAPATQPEAAWKDGAWMQPLRTHLLTEQDDLAEVVRRYAGAQAQPGDVVILAETAVAIAQGRYYTPSEIRPGWLATRLCHFFPLKGSLGTRYTLQALMNEHGAARILLAAVVGTAAKAAGYHGLFYRLAGEQARLIDDLSGTLPPFDKYVVLGPRDSDRVVRAIQEKTGLAAAIVDANDGNEAFVLAASPGVDVAALTELMRLNPQGNDDQQTPLVLVRPAARAAQRIA